MEKMREAMSRSIPKAVQKALQQMKLSQKDLEQGLDRTLQMLERLLAEEKLDEMIKKSEQLTDAAEQDESGISRRRRADRSPTRPPPSRTRKPQEMKERQEQTPQGARRASQADGRS